MDTQEIPNEEVTATPFQAGYSPITCKLIEAMKDGKPGDTKTDDELLGISGKPCAPNQKGYSYLQSAIRFCERMGVTWSRVRDAGTIRCVNDPGKIAMAERDSKHIRRTTRRSVRRLGFVDREKLTDAERIEYDSRVNQLGTVVLMTEEKTRKKLEGFAAKQIDRSKMIELFK